VAWPFGWGFILTDMFRGSFYGYEEGIGGVAGPDLPKPALDFVQKDAGEPPRHLQGLRGEYAYLKGALKHRGVTLLNLVRRSRVLPVDAPDQVGTFKAAEAMDTICKGVTFAEDACQILLDEDYSKLRCVKEEELKLLSASMEEAHPRTAAKYHSHLEKLSQVPSRGIPVLISTTLAVLLIVCTYFAVAKGCGTLARTIFNGRILKEASHVPPPVNLLDIVLLYQMIGGMKKPHVYIADIRGWFHVLKINAYLRTLFGIVCGCDCRGVWMWQVLPMGWSWSPYIAQCIGWALILHTQPSDPYKFDVPPVQSSPPQYRWLRRRVAGAKGPIVGFATLLYDNIGLFCIDAEVSQAFKKRVEATTAYYGVPLKYSDLFISGPRSPMRILPPHAHEQKKHRAESEEPRFPVYRGIQIGVATHDYIPCFRLDPSRVTKYRSWAWPVRGLTCSLNVMARYTGVILWRASLMFAAYADSMSNYEGVIAISRRLSVIAGGSREKWRREEVSLSENEAEQLGLFWKPLLENSWVKPRTPSFDAPAFVVATDAYKDTRGNGWGVCYLNEDIQDAQLLNARTVTFGGTFKGGLTGASIFLLELAIAYWTIQRLVLEGKKHIVIVIDNTGAAAVLRRMYSHNTIANEWMKRLGPLLQSNGVYLRVVSVRSADNASDAASRRRALTLEEYLRCRSVVAAELEGWRRHTPTCWTDRCDIRDFDPEDLDRDYQAELEEFDEVPGEMESCSVPSADLKEMHFADEEEETCFPV